MSEFEAWLVKRWPLNSSEDSFNTPPETYTPWLQKQFGHVKPSLVHLSPGVGAGVGWRSVE